MFDWLCALTNDLGPARVVSAPAHQTENETNYRRDEKRTPLLQVLSPSDTHRPEVQFDRANSRGAQSQPHRLPQEMLRGPYHLHTRQVGHGHLAQRIKHLYRQLQFLAKKLAEVWRSRCSTREKNPFG